MDRDNPGLGDRTNGAGLENIIAKLNTILDKTFWKDVDMDRAECVDACDRAEYRTECLARCGVNAATTYRDLGNHTGPWRNLSPTPILHFPEGGATMANASRDNSRRGIIRFDKADEELDNIIEVDIRYFYWLAISAFVPILILFYCCYRHFTRHPSQTNSNNYFAGSSRSNRSRQLHEARSAAPEIVLPSELQRTLSLPAYEDCVKISPGESGCEAEGTKGEHTEKGAALVIAGETHRQHHPSPVSRRVAEFSRASVARVHVISQIPSVATSPPSYKTLCSISGKKNEI